MSERILLIGDSNRQLQSTLRQSMPGAHIVSVTNFFDGIAELSARPYSAVLAAAEPIERRPESAVKTLRELTGGGRLMLFGHPTLEPLSRKMLEFGIDDYLVTPASASELQQIFGDSAMQMVPAGDDDAALPAASDVAHLPPRIAQLLGVQLAEVLMDALLQSPQNAPAGVISQINSQIGPTMQVRYTAADAAPPAGAEGSTTLSQLVRNGDEYAGSLHLTLPRDEEENAPRHFLAQLARVMGKVVALQDRHNRLQKLAITDELTGLYNGRYFRHFLNRVVDRAKAMRFPVTLLLFDIDNFKKYNDQYGHGIGDEILRQTSALMKRCVRDHDLVARISGDEFAVVFWEKEGPRQPREPTVGAASRTPHASVQILERFRRLLATQNFPGLGPAGQGTLTISGGLAVYPYDAQTVPALIEAADNGLMFKAKQSGKNSIFLVGGQGAVDGPKPAPAT